MAVFTQVLLYLNVFKNDIFISEKIWYFLTQGKNNKTMLFSLKHVDCFGNTKCEYSFINDKEHFDYIYIIILEQKSMVHHRKYPLFDL